MYLWMFPSFELSSFRWVLWFQQGMASKVMQTFELQRPILMVPTGQKLNLTMASRRLAGRGSGRSGPLSLGHEGVLQWTGIGCNICTGPTTRSPPSQSTSCPGLLLASPLEPTWSWTVTLQTREPKQTFLLFFFFCKLGFLRPFTAEMRSYWLPYFVAFPFFMVLTDTCFHSWISLLIFWSPLVLLYWAYLGLCVFPNFQS